ncbi:hypothetical protein TNCV_1929341 [Trichonephila clavipes]|nr:hypothetical protein TNCV_1929341 [Trichonephila clavipes]
MTLRICSDAFHTSPMQSLYVHCNQLPLDLRRRKLCLAYYFKIFVCAFTSSATCVYEYQHERAFMMHGRLTSGHFMDRMKLLISELNLPNVNIQQKKRFTYSNLEYATFPLYQPFCLI